MEEQLPSRRGTDNLVVAIRGQFATTWLSPRRRGQPSPPSGRVPWAVRGRHFLRAGRTVRAGLEVRGARCPPTEAVWPAPRPETSVSTGATSPALHHSTNRPRGSWCSPVPLASLAEPEAPGQWEHSSSHSPNSLEKGALSRSGPRLAGMRRGNCARLREPSASRTGQILDAQLFARWARLFPSRYRHRPEFGWSTAVRGARECRTPRCSPRSCRR